MAKKIIKKSNISYNPKRGLNKKVKRKRKEKKKKKPKKKTGRQIAAGVYYIKCSGDFCIFFSIFVCLLLF